MKAALHSILLATIIVGSCGDSQLPPNGPFGNVPAIVAENEKEVNDIKSKIEKDGDGGESYIYEIKLRNQIQLLEERLRHTAPTVVGSQINTETDKNIFITITKPMTVEEVKTDGDIVIAGEGELESAASLWEAQQSRKAQRARPCVPLPRHTVVLCRPHRGNTRIDDDRQRNISQGYENKAQGHRRHRTVECLSHGCAAVGDAHKPQAGYLPRGNTLRETDKD